MTHMPPANAISEIDRYARCITMSKRASFDIEEDVIRGREFDTTQKYLPDGISKVDQLTSLSEDEKRYLSQIQGRTYANMFGLVERFINAQIADVSRDHWFGDQIKLEALVRFSEEEIKHQKMFRRIEEMTGEKMPAGYCFMPESNDVAEVVLGKSTWSVLGLTMLIELFVQSHYRESIEHSEDISPLFRDVFHFHWMEECQHAILDELEWRREDSKMTAAQRDAAVNDFIELAVAVDGIAQMQTDADVKYFSETCGRSFDADEYEAVRDGVLKAYRWQYIFSGAEHPQFGKVLSELATEEQVERIGAAVATLK